MSGDEMDDVEVMHAEEEEDDEQPQSDAGSGSDEDEAAAAAAAPSPKGNKKAAAAATKGKGKAGAAAAAASSKKASPKKRKADGAGEGSAAKKGKAASGAAKLPPPDDPKELVRQYMIQQNRPYTALVIYENLHQQVKKPALIRILDELTEEGHLQSKDFKKVRVYLAKQSDESVPDPAELQSLADDEATAKEELSAVQASNTRLSEQLRALQNQPNDEELAKQLVDYKKQVDALNVRLARIKSEGKQVNKAGMNAVQSKFNDAATAWMKRRRAALDLVDMMAGEEGDPKQVIKKLGLETDEEADVKLADWKDLRKDVKK